MIELKKEYTVTGVSITLTPEEFDYIVRALGAVNSGASGMSHLYTKFSKFKEHNNLGNFFDVNYADVSPKINRL